MSHISGVFSHVVDYFKTVCVFLLYLYWQNHNFDPAQVILKRRMIFVKFRYSEFPIKYFYELNQTQSLFKWKFIGSISKKVSFFWELSLWLSVFLESDLFNRLFILYSRLRFIPVYYFNVVYIRLNPWKLRTYIGCFRIVWR